MWQQTTPKKWKDENQIIIDHDCKLTNSSPKNHLILATVGVQYTVTANYDKNDGLELCCQHIFYHLRELRVQKNLYNGLKLTLRSEINDETFIEITTFNENGDRTRWSQKFENFLQALIT